MMILLKFLRHYQKNQSINSILYDIITWNKFISDDMKKGTNYD